MHASGSGGQTQLHYLHLSFHRYIFTGKLGGGGKSAGGSLQQRRFWYVRQRVGREGERVQHLLLAFGQSIFP